MNAWTTFEILFVQAIKCDFYNETDKFELINADPKQTVNSCIVLNKLKLFDDVSRVNDWVGGVTTEFHEFLMKYVYAGKLTVYFRVVHLKNKNRI